MNDPAEPVQRSEPINPEPASSPELASQTQVLREITLSCGYNTDRGLRRELNEDSFLAADPIFAVADGMGGQEAGEVASRECIRTLREAPALAPGSRVAAAGDVQQALLQADARIRELTNARAGTTATGVVLVEEGGNPYWLVFNVGDSRTYRLSQGKFEQISVDHSEVQELVDAGHISSADALVHPRRHVITRALGTGNDIDADFWLIPVEDGDRYLICSDGLTNEISDAQIARTLATTAHPQDAVDSLIQAALRSGGRDNVTVLVVDARNDLYDPGLHTTAPRPAAEEDTLPKTPSNSEPERGQAGAHELPLDEVVAEQSMLGRPAFSEVAGQERTALDVIEDILDETDNSLDELELAGREDEQVGRDQV